MARVPENPKVPKDMHLHYSISSSSSMIYVTVLAFILTVVRSVTLESDTEALRFLWLSIDPITIRPSSYLTTWDFSVDPCDSLGSKFLGILCSIPSDNSKSRIIALELDAAGYDGFLTPYVGNLTELISLDLSKNLFRGHLPYTLQNLKELIRLSVSGNSFSGGIAPWIYGLQMAERIDLSNNLLSGDIPPRISELRRLIHLSLSNNQFSSRLPDLGGLWQLQTLDLSYNMLHGSLPRFPKRLTTLTLSHNRLWGHIISLGRLKQLRSADVSDNRFSGAIPKGLLGLPHLNYLNVSYNQLTAIEVINSLGKGSPLVILDAQGNHLQGHLPSELINFGSLEVINLAYNGLIGRIPLAYGRRLGDPWRRLFLDDNFLSGHLPHQFNSNTARIKGSLANNCLTCPINIPFCRAGQRPPSECVGESDNNL